MHYPNNSSGYRSSIFITVLCYSLYVLYMGTDLYKNVNSSTQVNQCAGIKAVHAVDRSATKWTSGSGRFRGRQDGDALGFRQDLQKGQARRDKQQKVERQLRRPQFLSHLRISCVRIHAWSCRKRAEDPLIVVPRHPVCRSAGGGDRAQTIAQIRAGRGLPLFALALDRTHAPL